MEVLAGIIIGAFTMIILIMLIVAVYVRVRGPFTVGPPE